MARSIPTTEPTTFAAGETVEWTRSAGDFPNDEYTLVAYFAGPDTFSATATADDAGYLFRLTATQTADKPAGTYQWRIVAQAGTGDDLERYPVAEGSVVVTANFATVSGAGAQLFEEQMVNALKARLLSRGEADLESYGLAGRNVQKIPFQQLRAELASWQQALWRKRNPGKLGPRVTVTFGG